MTRQRLNSEITCGRNNLKPLLTNNSTTTVEEYTPYFYKVDEFYFHEVSETGIKQDGGKDRRILLLQKE